MAKSLKQLPAYERLHELLKYDPATGIVRWKIMRSGWCVLGRKVGWVGCSGYPICKIDGETYMLHRIIWKMQTGSDPKEQVDHRDRDRTNNRWENLRDATPTENAWNAGIRKDNRAGARGVTPFLSKWQAKIQHKGQSFHLGTFSTVAEASAAYQAKARELRGEFA